LTASTICLPSSLFLASGFSHHHLAGFCCRHRHFEMHIVGRGNVDHVDIVALHESAPIRLVAFPARSVAERAQSVFGAGRRGFEHELVFQIEKPVRLPKGVRMRPAHETIANDTHSELFHNKIPPYSVLLTIRPRSCRGSPARNA
jgi:hypothetical protein